MDGIIFGGQLEDFAGSIHKEDSKNINKKKFRRSQDCYFFEAEWLQC